MKHAIVDTVARYIRDNRLLDKSDKCIVALSGGADSVALLLILQELGLNVEAAHCNFHLRGAEADGDEQFVVALCQRLGVTLHRIHFDTKEYASLHKQSIEMAARELRYSYFETLRKDIDAQAIAVAHHREDSVETVLMNLVRGTGLRGLAGIRPRNGFIVRPLLCVSRADIEVYLKAKGQSFVTDSTNLSDDINRNFVRLDIMPLLRRLNPSADISIFETAQRVSEAVKVYEHAIAQSVAEVTQRTVPYTYISIEKLLQQPSPEATLFEALRSYGFAPQMSEQIYANIDAPSGRTFCSEEFDLAFSRSQIVIARKRQPIKPIRLPEPGNYVVSPTETVKITISDGATVSRQPDVATIDADKVAFPLCIRNVEDGDRFRPFGMKGQKLVSDYLTDRKKNVLEKRRQLVVTDADGRIVWLVNERTSDLVRLDHDSRRTLTIQWLQR